MADLTLSTEMPQVLDQRKIWFTNLLLLGFDPIAQEDKAKVRFCREMFCHINKKGMEVIVHYLFNRLDSHIAYEEFRDCWPVYDKKQEAQFRKVCANWLTRIAKEDPESKIPRLSASLLMSPGGDRFEQLMLRFTAHVLRVMCLREAKAEEKQVYLSSFVTSPDSLRASTNRHILHRALQCHIVRHSQSVVGRLEKVASLHEQWRKFVVDQVAEYRSLSREKRELEAQIKAASTNLSSNVEEKSSVSSTPAADRARKNKMKTVRGFWKSLDEFLSKTIHEREVLETIAKGNANKYTIDAKDLQFQIPDVVLHMYEARLREGTVGNTFEGGKLNLLSLIQLWNCALQVMRDQFRESDVPSFEDEAEYMTEALQAHRGNLATSQNLKASLMEYQQSLQDSIEKLETELKLLRSSNPVQGTLASEGGGNRRSEGDSSHHPLHIPPITLPSLDLGLLPPSPQKARNLSSPDMNHLQSHLSLLSMPNDTVSTPEAVHNISQSIQKKSHSSHQVLPSQPSPSTATERVSSQPAGSPLTLSRDATTPTERSKGPAKSTAKRVKSSRVSRAASSHASRGQHKARTDTTAVSSERTVEASPLTAPTGGVTRGVDYYTGLKTGSPVMSLSSSRKSPQLTPTLSRLMDAMPTAHDILANQIASAVADSPQSISSPHTPEQQMHSLSDPLSALGTGAFVSHDKIPRTPISKQNTRAEGTSPLALATSPQAESTTASHSSTATPFATPKTPNIPSPSPTSHAINTTSTSHTVTGPSTPHTPTTLSTTPPSTLSLVASLTHVSSPLVNTSLVPPSQTLLDTFTSPQPPLNPHLALLTSPQPPLKTLDSPQQTLATLTSPQPLLNPPQSPLFTLTSPLRTPASPQQPLNVLTSPMSTLTSQQSSLTPSSSLIFQSSSGSSAVNHSTLSSSPLINLSSSSLPPLLKPPPTPTTSETPATTASHHGADLDFISSPSMSGLRMPPPPFPLLGPSPSHTTPEPSVTTADLLSFDSPHTVGGKMPPTVGVSPLKPEPALESLLLQSTNTTSQLFPSPVTFPPPSTETPLLNTSRRVESSTLFGEGTPVSSPGESTNSSLSLYLPSTHKASSPLSTQPVIANSPMPPSSTLFSSITPVNLSTAAASVSNSGSLLLSTPVDAAFNTPSDSSFLLSAQQPTPPSFLDDSVLSEEDGEMKGDDRSTATGGSEDSASISTMEQPGVLAEGGNPSVPPVSSEAIPCGLQISVRGSPQTSNSLSSSVDGTSDHIQAPSHTSLLASPTILHEPHLQTPLLALLSPSIHDLSNKLLPLTPNTQDTEEKTPSQSVVLPSATGSSGGGPTAQLIDFSPPVTEWRPLDVSVDHSSPSPPPPPPPATTPALHGISPKQTESNELNSTTNTEAGLFDQSDSFLVPFSPQNDLGDN